MVHKGNILIELRVSEKLYNELKIGAEKDGKEIADFCASVLFDCDVADME